MNGVSRRPHICTLIAVAFAALAGVGLPGPANMLLLLAAGAFLLLGGPIASLQAVLASLPFWMVHMQIGGTSWSPIELALLACGGITAIYAGLDLARSRYFHALTSWLPSPDLLFLASALVLVAVTSLLWVAEPDLRTDSVRSLRRVILEPLMVLPVATYAVRRGWLRPIALWVAAPAVGVALLALLQLAINRSTVDIGGFGRPIGTFTHPNNLAFYLERAIWFVPLAVSGLTKNPRLAIGITAIVALAALATLSRGLVLALALGALVYAWSLVRRHLRLAVAGVTVAAGLVFLSRVLADTDSSVDARTAIWQSSLAMLRDHPFTGVGLDQFFGQYGTRYVRPEGWAERYTSHPHNILLDFWLSLGLAGVVVVWLFGEALVSRIRFALAAPDWSFQRAAVAMLVAGMAHGLVDNSFFLPDLATWTWLGLVLASAHSPLAQWDDA